jgi:hypothetical protein
VAVQYGRWWGWLCAVYLPDWRGFCRGRLVVVGEEVGASGLGDGLVGYGGWGRRIEIWDARIGKSKKPYV